MVLHVEGLAGSPGLVHGFSTLVLGSMRATPAREALATALGLDPGRIAVAGAVHGASVGRVDAPGVVAGCDVLVTDRPGVALLATFADCYPILVHDPAQGALALGHAGWRGTAAGVATVAVEALRREYGSRTEDLVAGIGPGICGGCYEVGEEVAARFSNGALRPSPGGRFLLDLAAANRAQLQAAGVAPERIHAHGACTFESAELPSHRRSPDGVRFACLASLV